MYWVSHKSSLIGCNTSEADVQIDVPPVARTGNNDAARCIAHVKSEA